MIEKSTVVVAALFARRRDAHFEVLIFKRARHDFGSGLWEFPGGKLEAGETESQGLMREIYEELGVRIQVGDYVAEVFHRYPQRRIHLRLFLVKSLSGYHFDLYDHEDWAWVSEEKIRNYQLAEADQPLVPIVFQHLRQKF
jgi:mutator protein MutT